MIKAGVRGVIFDFDGPLLVESFSVSLQIMGEIAREFNLPKPDIKIFKKWWGHPLSEFLSGFREVGWPAGRMEKIKESFIDKEKDYPYQSGQPINQILLLLKVTQGKKLAVASNRTKPSVVRVMKRIEVEEHLFMSVMGRDNFTYPKPDGRSLAPIVKLMQDNGVQLESTVYIGDTFINLELRNSPLFAYVSIKGYNYFS